MTRLMVWFFIVSQHTDIYIADSVPVDCATFRIAKYITGLKVLVDTLSNTNLDYWQAIPNPLEAV